MTLEQEVQLYLEKGKAGEGAESLASQLMNEQDIDKIRAIQAEMKARIKVCGDLLGIIKVYDGNSKTNKKKVLDKQARMLAIEKETKNLRYGNNL